MSMYTRSLKAGIARLAGLFTATAALGEVLEDNA